MWNGDVHRNPRYRSPESGTYRGTPVMLGTTNTSATDSFTPVSRRENPKDPEVEHFKVWAVGEVVAQGPTLSNCLFQARVRLYSSPICLGPYGGPRGGGCFL